MVAKRQGAHGGVDRRGLRVAMLFLVDGYNVTKGDPATRELSLEDQRMQLIARLRVRGSRLLGRGRTVVVFDAAGGVGDTSGRSGDVEIRFARTETADDLIVSLTRSAREPVCLVTSDVGLRERVRAHRRPGSTERGRETLFEAGGQGTAARSNGAGKRGARRSGERYPSTTVGLPKGANRITEELKDLWLDEGE